MYQSNDDLTICVKLLYWGFQLVNLINFLGLDIDIIISLFLLLPTLYSILFDDKKLNFFKIFNTEKPLPYPQLNVVKIFFFKTKSADSKCIFAKSSTCM